MALGRSEGGNMRIYPNLFCLYSHFENQVIGILNKHLFSKPITPLSNTSSAITSIHDIYEDMRSTCDFPDIDKKYMIDGSCVAVNRVGLTTQGHIYAGHDLPIWINDPDSADCKIMIVGQDPRRTPAEMYDYNCPTMDQITISSPFGMHMRYHRRKINTIPKLVLGLIDCASEHNKKMSVYLTDLYKMRGVDPSGINAINIQTYLDVLKEEITLFNPCVIILLGKQVMNDFGICGPYFSTTSKLYGKYTCLPVPHPSGANANEIKKVKEEKGCNKPTAEFLTEEICKQLKHLCCDRQMLNKL